MPGYSLDADPVTFAGRVAGQGLYSSIGPGPDDAAWLVTRGEEAALVVTLTV